MQLKQIESMTDEEVIAELRGMADIQRIYTPEEVPGLRKTSCFFEYERGGIEISRGYAPIRKALEMLRIVDSD